MRLVANAQMETARHLFDLSLFQIQDVSYRYSVDHAGLKTRRKEVREKWLTDAILKMSNACQANYSDAEKKRLTERRYR